MFLHNNLISDGKSAVEPSRPAILTTQYALVTDVIYVYLYSVCIGALPSLLLTGNGRRAHISHLLFEVPLHQTETHVRPVLLESVVSPLFTFVYTVHNAILAGCTVTASCLCSLTSPPF